MGQGGGVEDRSLHTGNAALPSRLVVTFSPAIFPKVARARGLEARIRQMRGTVITAIFIRHQRKQKPRAEAHVPSSGFPKDSVRFRSAQCRPLNQGA